MISVGRPCNARCWQARETEGAHTGTDTSRHSDQQKYTKTLRYPTDTILTLGWVSPSFVGEIAIALPVVKREGTCPSFSKKC